MATPSEKVFLSIVGSENNELLTLTQPMVLFRTNTTPKRFDSDIKLMKQLYNSCILFDSPFLPVIILSTIVLCPVCTDHHVLCFVG